MAAKNLAGNGTCDCLGAVPWGVVRVASVGAGASTGVVEPDPRCNLFFVGAKGLTAAAGAAGASDLNSGTTAAWW